MMNEEFDIANRQNSIDVRNYGEMNEALKLAEYTIYKRYLNDLSQYPVLKPDELMLDEDARHCIRALCLRRLCNKKGEDIFQKLSTVYHASMEMGCALFVMIDAKSNNEPADIYLGIRNSDFDAQEKLSLSFSTLKNGILSNFPGTKLESVSSNEFSPVLESVFSDVTRHIASVSCIAAPRDKEKTENKDFIQGIEKLIDSMKGCTYTALLIAEPLSADQRSSIRKGYEEIYSVLAPFQKTQWSYNESESHAVMENLSHGISRAVTEGTSRTQSHTESRTKGTTKGINVGMDGGIQSSSGRTDPTKMGDLGRKLSAVGMVMNAASSIVSVIPEVGPIAGVVMGGAGGIIKSVGSVLQTATAGSSVSSSLGKSLGVHVGGSYAVSNSTTQADATADTTIEHATDTNTGTASKGTTDTRSQGRTIQLENENKAIQEVIACIDRHLQRMREYEDYGAYNCGAYFISAKQENSILAANTYKSLMLGEGSGIENSAINYWSDESVVMALKEYLKRMEQPIFVLPFLDSEGEIVQSVTYSAGTVVGGRELPIHLGLPMKSIDGLPVYEMASFGRSVFVEGEKERQPESVLRLGEVYYMGSPEGREVSLGRDSLAMHTFVTGATGAGKSNVIYQILRKLRDKRASFLVVEPTKGEYKHIFGNEKDVFVFGTNIKYSPMLKINPFKFPEKVHVLEHIDRLIEIFNACWPMYAAMPAVLKDSVEKAYIVCGWDLDTSENRKDKELFPTFADVLHELNEVIRKSAFSQEVKDNYIGSLSTRIASLTNGFYGRIFGSSEIGDDVLFDKNVIIDLSRVGSMETKSLIMGILVMRLQEYRMTATDMNAELRHITVLEEAHNLLRRTSVGQSNESSNLIGKSVEMIANAIAEMRTYGEGFIIADQAPGLLDKSVIRNTNTKIILRLPDEEDRRLAGQAAGLTEDQIKELAKLPKGVAAVYQNNWLEPVLCKVDYAFETSIYKYEQEEDDKMSDKRVREEILQYLLSDISEEEALCSDPEMLKMHLIQSNNSGILKAELLEMLKGPKPKHIEELYRVVANCVDDLNDVFMSARKISGDNLENWNVKLLQQLNFETDNLSEIFRNNVLECIIHERSLEIRNENCFHEWMKHMGRECV